MYLSTYSKSAADRLRRYNNEFDAIRDTCMTEYLEGYGRWATFLRNDQQMSNDRDSIEIRRMEINRIDIICAALQQSGIVYYYPVCPSVGQPT